MTAVIETELALPHRLTRINAPIVQGFSCLQARRRAGMPVRFRTYQPTRLRTLATERRKELVVLGA